MLTTLASYRLASTNIQRSLSAVAEKPQVARDTEYYLANIGNVKSIDDFMADDRLFKYAMKAWGLQDMDYAKAFMRKVLTEGIQSSKSFANTLADPRYKEFADAFNFYVFGEQTTTLYDTKSGTVERYMRQTVEEEAGNQSGEGVRLALYFERTAKNITSPMAILADKALLKVAQTALGLPETMSLLDLDKQVDMITKKLDVEDFQDPEKVKDFLTRFTAMYDINNGDATASQSPAVILMSQPKESLISVDLLTNLQKLKLGGI